MRKQVGGRAPTSARWGRENLHATTNCRVGSPFLPISRAYACSLCALRSLEWPGAGPRGTSHDLSCLSRLTKWSELGTHRRTISPPRWKKSSRETMTPSGKKLVWYLIKLFVLLSWVHVTDGEFSAGSRRNIISRFWF